MRLTSVLTEEEENLPMWALIGLVIGKVLMLMLLASTGVYLLQFKGANAIDYIMIKCVLLTLGFLVQVKLKNLGPSDVPRYAWPWIIIHSVFWTTSSVLFGLALTTVSLCDLFAIYDALLLGAWAWKSVRLQRPALVIIGIAMTIIGLILITFSGRDETFGKRYSHTAGIVFGLFSATSMAAVVGTNYQVKSVDFSLLMFVYNLSSFLCLLIWDIVVWANNKREPLETLSSWIIFCLILLAFLLEFGARTV